MEVKKAKGFNLMPYVPLREISFATKRYSSDEITFVKRTRKEQIDYRLEKYQDLQ